MASADQKKDVDAEEERKKMLGEKSSEGNGTEEKDRIATEEGEGGDNNKKSLQNGHAMLLGPEQIADYRKNPFWRALRFILLGSVIFLFVLLLLAAILIVALSAQCSEISLDGTTMPSPSVVGAKKVGAPTIGGVPRVSPTLLSVTEGDSALFNCEWPRGKVRWNRIGKSDELKPPAKDWEHFKNGTLRIGNVTKSDRGEYVCEGGREDQKEGQWIGSERVKLIVAEVVQSGEKTEDQMNDLPPPLSAPSSPPPPRVPPFVPNRFLLPKVAVAVRPRVDSYLKLASAGEPVHFRCWMVGKHSVDLVWRKSSDANLGGIDVSARSSRMEAEPDGHSAFLIFDAVREADAGEYECVEAQSGTSSSTVRLRVEPSRSPIVEPMEQTVAINSRATIRCSVPGHPSARLIWRRENGVEVGTVEGVTDDGRGTLQIGGTRKEHARMGWVCWAIYAERADKQALSAGPAVITVEETEEAPAEEEGPSTAADQPKIDEEESNAGKEEAQEEGSGEEEPEEKEGGNEESSAEQKTDGKNGTEKTDEEKTESGMEVAEAGQNTEAERDQSDSANAQNQNSSSLAR